MEIENFTVSELFKQDRELINSYVVALKYIEPRPTARKLFHLKLKHVEQIKSLFNSGKDENIIEIISIIEKIKKEDVLKLKIVDFFGLLNSVKKQLITIRNAEESSLTPTKINLKWEMVEGSKKMAKFGIYNTLEQLSGGNILQYKKIMNMQYSEIFTILLMKKTVSDLQAQMDEIKTTKNA